MFLFIPDPDFFPSRIRIPGSKKHRIPDQNSQHWNRDRFFPDPGSPTHISESLVSILWEKNNNSLSIGSNFFLYLSKNKIIRNFCEIWDYKKSETTNFSPSFFLDVFGSEMEKNQDPK
jgi:hypothetical protein